MNLDVRTWERGAPPRLCKGEAARLPYSASPNTARRVGVPTALLVRTAAFWRSGKGSGEIESRHDSAKSDAIYSRRTAAFSMSATTYLPRNAAKNTSAKSATSKATNFSKHG